SLKCRSSVQQVQHDQYQKIMQICKARSKTDNNHSNNDSSSEGDDSLSVDLFGTRFFITNGGNKFSNIQSWKDPNENRYTNGNRQSSHSSRSSNNHDFSYSNGAGRSSYDQTYDNFENYGRQQEQVDQRGYPEQVSIIQFMTRNTHNPELQDLIEEAVIECFHYLDSDARQNACYFSENLLTCLIDKGKEVCIQICQGSQFSGITIIETFIQFCIPWIINNVWTF
ncbi:hypothetical protein ALC56_00588, partial [Trachymyrmex septentrionalis]